LYCAALDQQSRGNCLVVSGSPLSYGSDDEAVAVVFDPDDIDREGLLSRSPNVRHAHL
jgi:hypothetical protein